MPEIALIGGTPAVLGAGVALLFGQKLSSDQRKGAGWALLAVCALTMIPLVINIFGKRIMRWRIERKR